MTGPDLAYSQAKHPRDSAVTGPIIGRSFGTLGTQRGPDPMTVLAGAEDPLPADTIRAAQHLVASHALDADDCRQLLDALGIGEAS